jgi:hypothetical protein
LCVHPYVPVSAMDRALSTAQSSNCRWLRLTTPDSKYRSALTACNPLLEASTSAAALRASSSRCVVVTSRSAVLSPSSATTTGSSSSLPSGAAVDNPPTTPDPIVQLALASPEKDRFRSREARGVALASAGVVVVNDWTRVILLGEDHGGDDTGGKAESWC